MYHLCSRMHCPVSLRQSLIRPRSPPVAKTTALPNSAVALKAAGSSALNCSAGKMAAPACDQMSSRGDFGDYATHSGCVWQSSSHEFICMACSPSMASYTGTVASFLCEGRSHRMATLSRPAVSRRSPSGVKLREVTALKWSCIDIGPNFVCLQ